MHDDLYREEILDHYHHPRNAGKLDHCSHHALKDNPLCGDKIEIFLQVEVGTIRKINFVATGCAISVASASMLSEMVTNWKIERTKKLAAKDILEMLKIELTPTRLKCALLSLETLQRALP
ncbi:MAG: iron-sulfur cluster assembly scaffold protein [Patescibacteria group bacterium]|jgi:nitrogen fixation NifU-like protein